jgi:hypothetical protein
VHGNLKQLRKLVRGRQDLSETLDKSKNDKKGEMQWYGHQAESGRSGLYKIVLVKAEMV